MNRGTGIGSMPGEDFRESLRTVLGEVGELPYLPELPSRGPAATMTGRSLALLSELGADLQPAGWRLTDAEGVDQRRARSLLAHDLDVLEELASGQTDTVKVQVAGPWTLAATVERPRGDKVLADHGARRDLAQALAEGVAVHVDDVRRRLAVDEVVVQVDEPALPSVLSGSVPTASGFHRHRSVSAPAAAEALDWVLDAVRAAGGRAVLHCCGAGVPFPLLQRTGISAVSFDVSLLERRQYDDVGAWLDSGREVWLGVVPTTDPGGAPPTGSELTRTVIGWWSELGFDDPASIPPSTVTPACGLAGATPQWARQALALSHGIARNLSVEQGKMEP